MRFRRGVWSAGERIAPAATGFLAPEYAWVQRQEKFEFSYAYDYETGRIQAILE